MCLLVELKPKLPDVLALLALARDGIVQGFRIRQRVLRNDRPHGRQQVIDQRPIRLTALARPANTKMLAIEMVEPHIAQATDEPHTLRVGFSSIGAAEHAAASQQSQRPSP